MVNAIALPLRRLIRLAISFLPRLRIASRLTLFAFAATHLINHAFVLGSRELMQRCQQVHEVVTRITPRTLLVAAAAVHFFIGISKFLSLRSWRVDKSNVIQLAFPALIPIFLIWHVLGAEIAQEVYGIDDSYDYVLGVLWPREAVGQAILIILVWVHGSIGVHHWLMREPSYRSTTCLWYGLAVLIAALSYASFATTGRAIALQGAFKSLFTQEQYALILNSFTYYSVNYYGLLAAAIAFWAILLFADRFGRRIAVQYASGLAINMQRGITLLEVNCMNCFPLVCVCGGRARRSTCRGRSVEGFKALPPALVCGLKVLRQVGAPQNVRLAYHLWLVADITISTLLPTNTDLHEGSQADKYLLGVEKDLAVIFCDLRGFAPTSEEKLSIDVVFLLNQFLGRMAEAIEETGGYVEKFMGDGIVSIFGMDEPAAVGATQAMAAARAISGLPEQLNLNPREELPHPLGFDIGVHKSAVILGRMEVARATEVAGRITALGETVNIASRLEGMTKELGVEVILSQSTAQESDLPPDEILVSRKVKMRGMRKAIEGSTALWATKLHAAPMPGQRVS
jgi:adenylate cyclase